MPVYSYRYRRRYGRRYSRYRRYGAYSRYRRRRSGTSSTASSRGRIRVRVPVQQIVTLTIPANSTDSNVLTSTPYYHAPGVAPLCVCGATASPLYRAYTSLYDQVKCDGVVTAVSVVSPIGAVSGAAAQALQVVLAYDRAGTYAEAANSGQQLSVGSFSTSPLLFLGVRLTIVLLRWHVHVGLLISRSVLSSMTALLEWPATCTMTVTITTLSKGFILFSSYSCWSSCSYCCTHHWRFCDCSS